MSVTIGVLAIQGDVTENVLATQNALEESDVSGHVIEVKTPQDVEKIDGLILPGGESTMMGQLSLVNGSLKQIKEKISAGMPVFGICAGLIMLSKNASDRIVGNMDQPLLDMVDVTVERNSFGRQQESFEAKVSMNSLGISEFNGVFIRAPSISQLGDGVEAISKFNDKVIAIKKDNILGTAFHPELTQDVSLHKYFVNMVSQAN